MEKISLVSRSMKPWILTSNLFERLRMKSQRRKEREKERQINETKETLHEREQKWKGS